MMTFYREILRLLRPFWGTALWATAVGGLSGAATVWLLATINRALHAAGGASPALLAEFAALAVLSIAGTTLSGLGNNRVGQKTVAALRKSVSASVLHAPIAEIEAYGSHRLLAVLTTDIDAVSSFAVQFSSHMISIAVLAGSLLYLLLLSGPVFALCAAGAVLFFAAAAYGQRRAIRGYERVRNAEDDLRKQYRAITDGAKELRLNRARRARIHGTALSGAADRIAALRLRALGQFWGVDAAGTAIFFAVIGILLAARLGAEATSAAVLVLLFVKGPMEQIVSGLPSLGQAQVSFRRIAALSAAFSGTGMRGAGSAPAFESIGLRGAAYRFPGFALGPVDLDIHRGETLFVVGENGSGKTTLIKLLLGLYVPHGGVLLRDGEPVATDDLDDFRQLFSAVFSDYFLFEDLASPEAARRATPQLERFEIAHKVRVADGAFTTVDLSSGERKRLALVHALAEDRPILMLDEWPADQDPTFRRVFYTELLPSLKRQGKTLIVVSHDDRYFGAADRIVRLQGGKIAEDPLHLRLPAE